MKIYRQNIRNTEGLVKWLNPRSIYKCQLHFYTPAKMPSPKASQTKVPRSKQTHTTCMCLGEHRRCEVSLQKSIKLPKNICEDKYKDSNTMFMNRTQYKKKEILSKSSNPANHWLYGWWVPSPHGVKPFLQMLWLAGSMDSCWHLFPPVFPCK